jgi:hypothetical protein
MRVGGTETYVVRSQDHPASVATAWSSSRLVPTIDQLWVFVALAAPMIAGLVYMRTIDLAYHIRVGEQILRHGIPHVDSLSFTAAGRPWIDQQWGAQAIFAMVYRVGSWPALSLLRAGLMFLTFVPVWLACRARGASPRTASIMTMAAFGMSLSSLGMRPQMVALPLFSCTAWLVLDRQRHSARLWVIPFVAVAWSNLHGSFVLAPAVLTLALIEDLRRRVPWVRTTAAVTVTTFLSTLVTPFGVGAWRYAFTIAGSTTIRNTVTEWAPTSVGNVSGVLFFASAAAVTVFLARRREPTPWPDLMWLGLFFTLALPALRGVVWWSLVAPAVVAGLLVHGHPSVGARQERNLINLVVALSLIALFCLMLPWRPQLDARSGASSQLVDAPEHLVQATADAVPVGGHIFVSQTWASWFEFALPDRPVFVDSRIEIFPGRVWNDYLDVMDGHVGWQGVLSGWSVDAVVLRAEDTTLGSLIGNDPGWRLAYRDDLGSVFLRADVRKAEPLFG